MNRFNDSLYISKLDFRLPSLRFVPNLFIWWEIRNSSPNLFQFHANVISDVPQEASLNTPKMKPILCHNYPNVIAKSSQSHLEIMLEPSQHIVTSPQSHSQNIPNSSQCQAQLMPRSKQNHPNSIPKWSRSYAKIILAPVFH